MRRGLRKGDRYLLPERPCGCCAQKVPVPFSPAAMKRAGFSLLEVILALAILAGAVAVLGEAIRQAQRNAEVARELAKAQLLCESKLAEIAGGMITAQSVGRTPFDEATTLSVDSTEPAWLYWIETGDADEEGLISVRVTVARDLPPEKRPVQFSLVRWVPDPGASTSEEDGSSTSTSSGSTSTGGTGSGTSQ